MVAVRDLESASDHYARLLGRDPSLRAASPSGTQNVMFRLANTTLSLMSIGEPTGPVGGAIGSWLERRGDGLFALVFETDDVAGMAGVLRARGLDARDPVDGDQQDPATGVSRRWRQIVLPPSSTRGTALVVNEDLTPAPGVPLAPLGVAENEAVSGLDHVVVGTSDAEAARRLYQEGLGLRLALDRRFDERGIRILFFRVGGVTIELVARLETTPSGDEPDRLQGLAFQVPDVPIVRERLLRQGFDVSEHRAGFKPGTRVCSVRSDTHGVATLLIGPDTLA